MEKNDNGNLPYSSPYPFWGSPTSIKGGRDPLAVQNSSVVIYTEMVQGITNVTTRVRYNGFYCWLLNFISKRLFNLDKKKANSKEYQIRYLRRAELLLADAMVFNFADVTGVNGSLFAKHHIESEVLDLKNGAEGKNTYWRNSMGIFGQYYVGVLLHLGLICSPDENHQTYRTAAGFGEKLADAYGKAFSKEAEEIFWNGIYNGKLRSDDLAQLKCMALHILPDGQEKELYREIFSAKDSINIISGETFYRRESICRMMDYISEHPDKLTNKNIVSGFLEDNFLFGLEKNPEVSNVQLSWFLYELDELAHTAYESFHYGILWLLTKDPQPLNRILSEIREGIEELAQKNDVTKLSDLNVGKNNIYNIYHRMFARKKRKSIERIYDAAILLMTLYGCLNPFFVLLDDFSCSGDFNYRRPGYAPDLLRRLVDGHSNDSIWKFVEFVLYQAINDHTQSSYSKSVIGQGLVNNYLIEDDMIWLERETTPIRTSPRLGNVVSYIEDMGWIARNQSGYYFITQEGRKLLEKYDELS